MPSSDHLVRRQYDATIAILLFLPFRYNIYKILRPPPQCRRHRRNEVEAAGEIDKEEEMDAEADALWLNTGRASDPESLLAFESLFRAAKIPRLLRFGSELKFGWVGEGEELAERVVKISCSESSSGGGVVEEEEEDGGCNIPKNLSADGGLRCWRKRIAAPTSGSIAVVCVILFVCLCV
ncbi:hypothetical protein MIMGU_mgv1a014757mg [Erythranthe guttata]|uniref:Uncharacterized protein n=1 Tax=Erythranthe guttata TaxID=4155 RepID=A0A022QHG3_ERYGU|nr:hypothetical protein MIMGU_mgv1a014757mg [Erythranthe guttata]